MDNIHCYYPQRAPSSVVPKFVSQSPSAGYLGYPLSQFFASINMMFEYLYWINAYLNEWKIDIFFYPECTREVACLRQRCLRASTLYPSFLLSATGCWPVWTTWKDFLNLWFLGRVSKGGRNTDRRPSEEKTGLVNISSRFPFCRLALGWLWPLTQITAPA